MPAAQSLRAPALLPPARVLTPGRLCSHPGPVPAVCEARCPTERPLCCQAQCPAWPGRSWTWSLGLVRGC